MDVLVFPAYHRDKEVYAGVSDEKSHNLLIGRISRRHIQQAVIFLGVRNITKYPMLAFGVFSVRVVHSVCTRFE